MAKHDGSFLGSQCLNDSQNEELEVSCLDRRRGVDHFKVTSEGQHVW